MSRRSLYRLVVAIAVGVCVGWLLFDGLRTKGFCYYDEAYNVLEARFLYEGLRLGCGYASARVSGEEVGLRDYVRGVGRPDGYYPSYGKPVHSLILASGLVVSGGRNWGAHFAIACCGLVWLLSQWRWGAALAGERAGRWGALLLACSAYFVIYARETLAETDSVALMTMGLWGLARLRVRAPRRPRLSLLLLGAVFGLSFAANYRWFWLPLIMVAEVACVGRTLWMTRGGVAGIVERRGVTRPAQVIWLLTGFSLPLVVAELPGVAMRAYFHRVGLPVPFETYFEQLSRLYFFHATSGKGLDLDGFPTYAYLLWRWTSPLFLLAVVAGAARLMSGRRGRGLFAVVPPLVILGFYSVYEYNFARFGTLALPFLSLLAGVSVCSGAVWLCRRARWSRRAAQGIVWGAGLVVMLSGLPSAWRAREVVSPYPLVSSWIQSHGGGLCAASEAHELRVEYGARGVVSIPPGLESMEQLRDQGVRWVALGPLRRYWGVVPAVEQLTVESRPAAQWENSAMGHEQYEFEHAVNFRDAYGGRRFSGLDRIELYELTSGGGVPQSPSR